ncbi:16S rRNA (guanine(966)-N(2))-methyltransferase RsmD [Paenibacillus rhizovicinus]|uniref:16S rRNA (Guanine(966)-N(2))-methyltransferase RsmD n=1 Tax=Paenibacillus rhizovicinus TaxID=2704463 RepID=A0A6C0NV88_9BACL|nr:16S rRNA (guanine(966)-N(2))-methyltransferase RsmD [Paenibacillus rhizovicinus]QHW30109.1 16S rRNA (guanine(966)-N(2))-methyltransferase RsmD [Paenibacillus rhizovicinus]
MRVIAGTAKGRSLKAVPGKNTRPTTDKVKEAIFSMIGPYFDGGSVLDLFAGTGGLGIEAMSRGADNAVFIDLEGASIEVIKQNLQAAGLSDRAEIYRTDAVRAVKALAKRDLKFALVFLDPPYRMKDMDDLMTELATRGLLEEDATVVVEHDAEHRYPESVAHYRQLKHSEYGDTAVTIYRYDAGEASIETVGVTEE